MTNKKDVPETARDVPTVEVPCRRGNYHRRLRKKI